MDAVVCPECGSDDETGWSEDTAYDGLYLYEDDFAPKQTSKSPSWLKWLIPLVIIITLSAFLAASVPWGIYLIPVIILAAGTAYYFMEISPKLQANQEEKLFEALLTRAQGDYAMVEQTDFDVVLQHNYLKTFLTVNYRGNFVFGIDDAPDKEALAGPLRKLRGVLINDEEA